MTKELLDSFKSKKEEIAELNEKLFHLGEGDTMMDNDTILDYRKGYPVPRPVIGINWDKINRRKKRYQKRINELNEECQEVEDFIENISDSLTRRIFRMYYVEGLSQKDIAKNVHMDRSGISKKISEYLKILQNMY